MAKRRAKSSLRWPETATKLLTDYPRETVGATLVALGVVAALTLAGGVPLLARLLGIGAWPMALALVVAGVLTLLWPRLNVTGRWGALTGLEIAYFALLALAHQLTAGTTPVAAAEAGRGGGMVGYALSNLGETALGPLLSLLLFLSLFTGGLYVAIRWSPWVPGWMVHWRSTLASIIEALLPQPAAQPSLEMVALEQTARPAVAERPAATPKQTPRPGRKKEPQPTAKAPPARKLPAPRNLPLSLLPPLTLLQDDMGSGPNMEEAQARARTIEETLHAFGVPAQVVDIRVGPAVTQFGVEPGLMERRGPDGETVQARVRVSRIVSLASDLALALSAAPIRIEAPVPGRPYVGIEVPNGKTDIVTLRSVLESPAFQKHRSPLALALGRGVDGEPIAADLAKMPHLLIAGATGSGKSVCMNAIITTLLMNNPPEQLRLVLVDPKRVELVGYNGIPHLVAPVVVEMDQATAALTWVSYQMEDRYKRFAALGVRNLEGYTQRKGAGDPALPHLVVIIDELADLMMSAPEETERYICRLAQMARATGIHLIIATQRPSVDVVTGLIKANFPARIAFAVASQVDSRVILDNPGAERLLGRGDMLFMSTDASSLRRIQGCYLSDAEIGAVADFWRQAGDAPSAVPPWASLLDDMDDGGDAMLQEAVLLLPGRRRISASLLQRQLRIGYPRAARLMDELEAQGYVGPDLGGGRSREVLLKQEQDEAESPADSPDDGWEEESV